MTDLLPLLREIAEKAGLVVRRLGDDEATGSGLVRVKGKPVLMLFRGETPERETALYLEALRGLDLTGVFLPPAVREALGRE